MNDEPIKEVNAIEAMAEGKDFVTPKESIREEWKEWAKNFAQEEPLATPEQRRGRIADWFLSRTIPREELKEGIENIKNPYDIDSMSTFRKGFDKAKDLIISLISKQ